MSGNATLKAAREIRERVINKAAEMLNVNSEKLDLINEKVMVSYDSSQYMEWVMPLLKK